MRLETVARKIIRGIKGWRIKDERDDAVAYPSEHRRDLVRVLRELERIQKPHTRAATRKSK